MSQQQTKPTLKENNLDTPEHQKLYETGLEVRRKVVGEDYVENALEKGSSDFLRPLQQYATVSATLLFIYLSIGSYLEIFTQSRV